MIDCIILKTHSVFQIPFATNIGHLIAPNFGLGFSIGKGMVDDSMAPFCFFLFSLLNIRHLLPIDFIIFCSILCCDFHFSVNDLCLSFDFMRSISKLCGFIRFQLYSLQNHTYKMKLIFCFLFVSYSYDPDPAGMV